MFVTSEMRILYCSGQLGVTLRAKPVARFNDGGLLLQATEQDLGLALVRVLHR